MPIVRRSLLAIGLLAALVGLIWVGQGTGYFPYPASSFMISQTVWIYRGLMVAAAGLVVVLIARRL